MKASGMVLNRIADRRAGSSRALKEEDHWQKTLKLAKMHSNKLYFGCDDPFWAVECPVRIGMIKRREKIRKGCRK